MSSSQPSVEILVHITAPSKAADDANYRALAAAYQVFEPTVKTDLGSVGPADGVRQEGRTENPPMTQESLGFNSFSLSFEGADHNLVSPALRRTRVDVAAEITDPQSQSSWRPPPSVIADSDPENDISIAQYCSPTRILEHYLQGFDSSQSNSSQAVPSVDAPAARHGGSIPASQPPAFLAPQPLPPPSVSGLSIIPQSPLLVERKRRRADSVLAAPNQGEIVASSVPSQQLPSQRRSNVTRPVKTDTVIPSSGVEVIRPPQSLSLSSVDLIPSSRADSEPPQPVKRQKRLLHKVTGLSMARSSSDIGPRQDQTKRSQLSQRQQARQTRDGLEIHSPEPPVSCEHLGVDDIITENHRKLAMDGDMEKRFERRKTQARELRPFERGYWLVDCAAWPAGVRQDCWGFLTNYVGNGIAGWGVWCRRDEGLTWIRLYCWGCLAGYMYLMLWLASKRQLNYTGISWITGGKAVITMEQRYPRP